MTDYKLKYTELRDATPFVECLSEFDKALKDFAGSIKETYPDCSLIVAGVEKIKTDGTPDKMFCSSSSTHPVPFLRVIQKLVEEYIKKQLEAKDN